jgi:hypothetical protein
MVRLSRGLSPNLAPCWRSRSLPPFEPLSISGLVSRQSRPAPTPRGLGDCLRISRRIAHAPATVGGPRQVVGDSPRISRLIAQPGPIAGGRRQAVGDGPRISRQTAQPSPVADAPLQCRRSKPLSIGASLHPNSSPGQRRGRPGNGPPMSRTIDDAADQRRQPPPRQRAAPGPHATPPPHALTDRPRPRQSAPARTPDRRRSHAAPTGRPPPATPDRTPPHRQTAARHSGPPRSPPVAYNCGGGRTAAVHRRGRRPM